jgi:hypothetical protein
MMIEEVAEECFGLGSLNLYHRCQSALRTLKQECTDDLEITTAGFKKAATEITNATVPQMAPTLIDCMVLA